MSFAPKNKEISQGYRMEQADFGRSGMDRHSVLAVYNIPPIEYYGTMGPELISQAVGKAKSFPVDGDLKTSPGLWDEMVDARHVYPVLQMDQGWCYIPKHKVEAVEPTRKNFVATTGVTSGSFVASSLTGFGGGSILQNPVDPHCDEDSSSCNMSCRWND